MKPLFIACAILTALTAHSRNATARIWKADYGVQGQVVAMNLNGITAYTDVPSFLKALRVPELVYRSDSTLAALVRIKQREPGADTIRFECWELQGFGENIEVDAPLRPEASDIRQYWQTESVLIRLADANKLALYDNARKRRITHLRTKTIGSIESGHKRSAYIDRSTGKELFSAVLYYTISGCPTF